MKTVKNSAGITKNYGQVVASMFIDNYNKKGMRTVQLRQDVETEYPSTRVANSNSDSIFDASEFDLPTTKYSSIRTALTQVPEGKTLEEVNAMLAKSEAVLVKHISNSVEDVLTQEQLYGVQSGQRDLAHYKTSLRIVNKDGSPLVDANGDVAEPTYQQHFFKSTYQEDVDKRTSAVVEPAKRLTSLDELVS